MAESRRRVGVGWILQDGGVGSDCRNALFDLGKTGWSYGVLSA
jgi:hypothetical protein